MFNPSENTAILLILLVAIGIVGWSYNRAKEYGKPGILAWLQSLFLMAPWLVFFACFALGIYLNIALILLLLVTSTAGYIIIGNRLRAEGLDALLRQRTAEKIKERQESTNLEKAEVSETQSDRTTETFLADKSNLTPEILPIEEEDLKIIKNIFGVDTFFATETISYQEGAIFRGNLRGEPEIAYSKLSQNLKKALGDKYRLFLVESPEGKPVVIVLPSSNDPQPLTLAQKNLALVLLVTTIATTLETAGLLLNFDLFNNLGRYQEAIPLSLGLWVVLAAHEIGHRWQAQNYDLRLSIPFLIPSFQIGSFGAITKFESVIPKRQALFDVALAGPALGGIVSLFMLVAGLILSHPGSQFEVPTKFFQSSILVGSLAKVVLGSQMTNTLVDLNLLTIIGWLGLVITALNLLPAGQLDGGRIVQAIYGRKTARRTTIASLAVLGIVCIINPANPIPLYWALLILFVQRDLERPCLNELTEPDDTRAAWGLLALFLMLATLIPLSPSLAGQLGIGG